MPLPGQVVVEFRAGIGPTARRAAAASTGAQVASRSVPSFGSRRCASRRIRRRRPGRSIVSSPIRTCASPSRTTAAASIGARTTPLFDQWGTQHRPGRTRSPTRRPRRHRATPERDVSALGAWAHGGPTPSAVVAVIDTGVQTDQPDLTNQLTAPSTWRDFKDNDHDPDPVLNWPDAADWMHGTHVAGIVAAEQDNAIGVSGICPGCKVMPTASDSPVLGGAVHRVGGEPRRRRDQCELRRSALVRRGAQRDPEGRARGVLFVAAAGNNSVDNDVPTLTPKGSCSRPCSRELRAGDDPVGRRE